ncbi:DUF2812 domain-containing protein [Clostridium cibarium]|uniref:DUF2812 domain-containing protein n=1 Tax=Clostridium cibarium TaxID=2762247 RepID=UPI001FACB060|nr:DUF2812 domain-containing protein [Clostridium cibarium]
MRLHHYTQHKKTFISRSSEGWILEGITGGFFYKLKKDKPKRIGYTLDYQSEANEEYFTLFKEAGWSPVLSMENQMHIFSAKAGTKPIYTDCESEIDKYSNIRNITKKGSIISSIIAVPLICLLMASINFIRPIFFIMFGLLFIDFVIFTFNFMPYLAYNSRIKEIEKYGKYDSKKLYAKNLWKFDLFTASLFLAVGILYLTKKNYFSILFIIVFVFLLLILIKNIKNLYRKSPTSFGVGDFFIL